MRCSHRSTERRNPSGQPAARSPRRTQVGSRSWQPQAQAPIRMQAGQDAGSLDHLISAQQNGFGNRDAERFGGLEIYRQLKPITLFNRKVAGVSTLKQPINVV